MSEKIYKVQMNSKGMPNFSTAVEVEDRPQGEWIAEEKDCIYGKKIRLTCSECGDVFDVTEAAYPYERYCRYCGARMMGGDDE